MKTLADEELEQVSGGRSDRARAECCLKWYKDKTNPKRYVYIKDHCRDVYSAIMYTLDEAGNVDVRKIDSFFGYVLDGSYAEVSIDELPAPIRMKAGC